MLRVDNGGPWGASGQDLPTDVALWAIGLGVDMHWNPPRKPQDNGAVERSQGTGKRWADPGACDTPAQLQEAVDAMDAIQRQEYPVLDGKSRSEVYPELAHSGREYSAGWEEANWDHGRCLEHLGGYVLPRRVCQSGKVWLYHQGQYVGKMHAGKDILVTLDPQKVLWVFSDKQGRELRTLAAEEVSAQRIRTLRVTVRE